MTANFKLPAVHQGKLFCELIGLAVMTLCGAVTVQAAPQAADPYTQQRLQMVEQAVKRAGITDERVLKVIRETPRHEFVPKSIRKTQAYLDAGLPIGEKQTISSPFIVAFMTQSIDPQPDDRVLEIGTGSGYQAAVLSPLVREVYTIEIVESLGRRAAKTLERLNYKNIFTKIGDGYLGWPEHAPFDKIIVTCSPESIPQPLVDQLNEGGMMIVPIGERHQQTLYLFQKKNGQMVRTALRPTLFVPMTGAAEAQRQVLPDPTNPQIINGDFEDGVDEEGFVKGWYYQRLAEIIKDDSTPSGTHAIEFKNSVPGQTSHLMQGFAIDGRQAALIKFSMSVACKDVLMGPRPFDLPVAVLTFYDDQREELNSIKFGPFRGTMDWKSFNQEIRVPLGTREAILRIGLFGATGVAKFDQLSIQRVR